jgi:hypothetical protein
VGGADAEGFGGRSRAPSPRTSLDREAEVSATGREPDVKPPPSPRDEVRVPITLLIQLDSVSLSPVLALSWWIGGTW